MRNPPILVIEDEPAIAETIVYALETEGFDVVHLETGGAGLEALKNEGARFVVLDVGLPDMTGFDVCREIRRSSDVPLLFLTARESEIDRVVGLEIGADDYVTKPFSVVELMARVKAILRRSELSRRSAAEQKGAIRAGRVTVDPVTRIATVRGDSIELTAKEFDLLHHFVANPGRVFRRLELLDSVWGYGHDGYEHTVNSHINRLRAKIEIDPANPELIVTVWGVGYKLSATARNRARA